jgi:hypothetical protein
MAKKIEGNYKQRLNNYKASLMLQVEESNHSIAHSLRTIEILKDSIKINRRQRKLHLNEIARVVKLIPKA